MALSIKTSLSLLSYSIKWNYSLNCLSCLCSGQFLFMNCYHILTLLNIEQWLCTWLKYFPTFPDFVTSHVICILISCVFNNLNCHYLKLQKFWTLCDSEWASNKRRHSCAGHSSGGYKEDASTLVNFFTLWPYKGLHNNYVDVVVFLWLLVYTWENWALPAKSHNVPKIIQLTVDGSTLKGSLAFLILWAMWGWVRCPQVLTRHKQGLGASEWPIRNSSFFHCLLTSECFSNIFHF